MAEPRSAAQADKRQWAQQSKDKAQFLMTRAAEIRRELFAKGDLTDFLDLLTRLHHFDATNLLLIYDRFPQATCLAGYNLWKRYIQPQGAQILKREWIGKGIDLIAPFTDVQQGQYKLTWYSPGVFDVAQTNVTYTPPPDPYQLDAEHLSILVNSLKDILDQQYDYYLQPIRPTESMLNAGIPGYLFTGKVSRIQYREDIGNPALLPWLTEVLVRLNVPEGTFSEPAQQLLINAGTYCLLRAWGVPAPAPHMEHHAVQSREEEQHPLLDRLREIVRTANVQMSAFYLAKRSVSPPEDAEADELPPPTGNTTIPAALTFHEANILIENLRSQDQAGFIARLDNLLRNTEDPQLLAELQQLLQKVQDLTPSEFLRLRKDTEKGNVLFPADYPLSAP